MARQIGYTEAELAALRDFEASVAFRPEVKAALTLAEKMAGDAHRVSDEDFAELARHYSESEIIELVSVIGLMSYFNRFSTALRVDLSGSDAAYESYQPEY